MKKQMQAIRWVMTLATILVLALLAWQCVDIYLEGNRPSNLDANGVYRSPVFSVEIVEARLRPLLPVLAVYGLMTLGALILQSTGKGVRPRGSHSPEDRLHLLKAHVATLPDEAKALERQRRVITPSTMNTMATAYRPARRAPTGIRRGAGASGFAFPTWPWRAVISRFTLRQQAKEAAKTTAKAAAIQGATWSSICPITCSRSQEVKCSRSRR